MRSDKEKEVAEPQIVGSNQFDRTNAVLAGLVFIVSFVVYALTVQRTISYWDCGEFAAAARILGIPHPPGTPLFVIIGRLFSVIPFVEDIALRINYISVISSALTAMFSYLLTVRLVQYFFNGEKQNPLFRFIAYCGGIAGGFFVAFSNTNWGNSVEAEVYGLALALSVAIVWLAVRFYEERGTPQAARTLVLAMYLALLGVGIHMTVFLVVPVCAIFFMFNREAVARDWALICGFAILELAMIVFFADGRGGHQLFLLISGVLGLVLLGMLFRKINWGILIAIISVSTIMMSFSLYIWATPISVLVILGLSVLAKQNGWRFEWKTSLAVILVAFVGFSAHFFLPIRSEHNPRLDENNPARDYNTFINFLDRKQYGQESMVTRMFNRRGELKNQLGRHAHMGFWSYFEDQYSRPGWSFAPFFLLGLLGVGLAVKKRMQIGMPILTLLLLTSVGLALYMNFADGTQYNFQTGDAYLEVRDRDYFFTPAFVFFGIAMGMGVSAIMYLLFTKLSGAEGRRRTFVYASGVLILLPGVALAKNYYLSDRSQNRLAYNYAYNILQSCEKDAILFTSGDNDTFPIWALQEVYDFRKDVRVVNLSLANTDWYIEQMKNVYDVPISLTDSQILWVPIVERGRESSRPVKQFNDRPRRRMTYLQPTILNDRIVKVADMMVDEIVLENKWENPIYFSSPPYAESPLRLRERAILTGIIYRLERDPVSQSIDIEKSYDLFMNTYKFDGFEDADVFREENSTGVQLTIGVSASRLYEALLAQGDTARAHRVLDTMLTVYPEYWQLPFTAVEQFDARGDSGRSVGILRTISDTLSSFLAKNPNNLFYMQDLGLIKNEMGRRNNDPALIKAGLDLMWKAFEANPNSSYAFRKLITALSQEGNMSEIQRAGRLFAKYKVNLNDPVLQRILGIAPPQGSPTPEDF